MQDRKLEDLAARVRVRARQDPECTSPGDPAGEAIERSLMSPLPSERVAAILDRVVGPSADTVIPLPLAWRSRWRAGLSVTATVLVAAAAVFLVVSTPPTGPTRHSAVIEDASMYQLTVLGGRGETRGSEDSPTFAAGDLVHLRLRPRDPIEGKAHASVRAVQGTRTIPLPWPARVTSAQGHLEISGAIDDLMAIGPGVWELEVAIIDDDDILRWSGHGQVRVLDGNRP